MSDHGVSVAVYVADLNYAASLANSLHVLSTGRAKAHARLSRSLHCPAAATTYHPKELQRVQTLWALVILLASHAKCEESCTTAYRGSN